MKPEVMGAQHVSAATDVRSGHNQSRRLAIEANAGQEVAVPSVGGETPFPEYMPERAMPFGWWLLVCRGIALL